MKVCSKCKVEKDESEFNKNKYRKDGFNGKCKDCTNEDEKNYRQNNREKRSEINKRYRERHLDKIKEKANRLRDKKREYDKEYRKNNAEKLKISSMNYRRKNAEKVKECERIKGKNRVESLRDFYIKQNLSRSMPKELITPELIEWKRVSIQIKRLIKEKQK